MKYRNQTWASPLLVALTVLALAVLDPGAVRANDVIVTIDTSAIANQNANLAFDFVAGGPPVFNTVSVSNFVTDAIQLSLSTTGSTTGGLPGDFSLDDTQFFNEVAGVFHLQNQISFDLQTTDAGPQPGSLPDEFSLFLLDPNTGNSLLNSSDPTGAGALLAIDLTGAGGPQVFDLSNAVTIGPDSPPSTVPEPASLYLLSGALLLLVGSRRRRARLRDAGRGWLCVAALSLAPFHMGLAAGVVTGVGQDPNLAITFSGLHLNHANSTYVTIAAITNNSGNTISGPFYLGITQISDPRIVVANGGGNLPDGNPYVPVPINIMPAGQTITTTVSFINSANTVFSFQAKIYDAVSAPPVATLTCPQDFTAAETIPTVAGYAPPVDSLGRVASCSPAPQTPLYALSTPVNCGSSGGSSLPATCSFNVSLPTFTVNWGGGPPPPPPTPPPATGPADLALIPCAAMLPLLIPGNPPVSSVDPFLYCGFLGNPGTANFSVANYGPNPAQNISLTMSFPPEVQNAVWTFSQAATCTGVMPKEYTLNILGVLFPAVGETVTCTFARIDPNTTIDVQVGADVISNDMPNLEASVAPDPASNTDSDPGNNTIRYALHPPLFDSISVPQSIAVQPACDYSHSPGFAILLNTCGVPQVVTQNIVGGVLGVATIVAGGAVLSLEFVGTADNIVFNAAAGSATGFFR